MQTGGFDMGLPQSSAAEPEYIAQQKFVDEMTTVYTWIASNSTDFIQGCREDREALITSVSQVVGQAQEASTVCAEFQAEAAACNPDIFCSRFESGMPVPPEMKSVLKDAGYDPENVTIKDMTQEMAIKMCEAQMEKEISKTSQRQEKLKENIRSQIPEFRKKCEEFERASEEREQNIRLPDFFPQNNGPGPQGPQEPFNPRPQNEYQEPLGEEPFYPPTDQAYPQEREYQESQPDYQQPDEENPSLPQEQPTEPEPMQEPATEPAPEATASTEWKATNAVTGFIFILNFEDEEAPQEIFDEEIQEAQGPQEIDQPANGVEGLEENYNQPGYLPPFINSPEQSTEKPYPDYGNQQGQPPYQQYNNQPQGNYQPPQNYESRPRDMGQRGPGPSPEDLCGMSDDEIVESYLGNMGNYGPSKTEVNARCLQESKHILREIGQLKLGIAQCKANAALDCAAKQESVKSCDEIKESPEKISGVIVNNMCRRFGIRADSSEAGGGLYDIAEEFYENDPALANQLGDTADQRREDKQKLNVFSYIIGDSEYSKKMKERADKLRAVKQRLDQGEVEDPEVVEQLEMEIQDLESEGNQFGNILDLGRVGRMFEPPK
ncbi:MAG: hypothetical protein NUV67_02795 [archaeon]|nr:hypothetical protein [archaeon]